MTDLMPNTSTCDALPRLLLRALLCAIEKKKIFCEVAHVQMSQCLLWPNIFVHTVALLTDTRIEMPSLLIGCRCAFKGRDPLKWDQGLECDWLPCRRCELRPAPSPPAAPCQSCRFCFCAEMCAAPPTAQRRIGHF